MNQTKKRRCPACRQGELREATWSREFHPHGKRLSVELLTSECSECGAQATTGPQHDENIQRLRARKSQYGGLLLGEEILSLRRRYGITQQTAAKIFGKGKIAFSRYENETSYPDASTTLLLEMALEKQDVILRLADKAGVELPLWEARCEDERRAKVHVIADVRKVDVAVNRWTKVAKKMPVHPPISTQVLRRWAGNTLKQSAQVVTANDDHFTMEQAAFG